MLRKTFHWYRIRIIQHLKFQTQYDKRINEIDRAKFFLCDTTYINSCFLFRLCIKHVINKRQTILQTTRRLAKAILNHLGWQDFLLYVEIFLMHLYWKDIYSKKKSIVSYNSWIYKIKTTQNLMILFLWCFVLTFDSHAAEMLNGVKLLP